MCGLSDKGIMANLWRVGLDDSDDGRRKVFIVAGALFGNKSAWNKFHKAWRDCLKTSPRIQYFHQKELTSLTGEFMQFRDEDKWPKPLGSEAANRKREALATAIEQSSLQAHGLALSIPDYLEVRSSALNAKRFLDKDPWIYLLQEVAFDTARRIEQIDPKASVAFVSDDSNNARRYTEFYISFKKKNPRIAKRMSGITHANSEVCYPVQAADLIAAEAKKCCAVIFQSGKIPKEIRLLGKFATIATIPKSRISELMAKQAINRADGLSIDRCQGAG